MERFVGILGLAVLLGLAYLFSADRRAIRPRTVLWGLALQTGLALLVLRTHSGHWLVERAAEGVRALLGFSRAGAGFVFGPLVEMAPFAFLVMPAIIFMSAFFAILYHYGVMQAIIRLAARVMMRLMKLSGAESMAATANVFLGQAEAPLSIRPFLSLLTRSELMVIMTAGFASTSGGMLVAYVEIGGIEARHLLTAVIMTAPASIVLAKMLVPETGLPVTAGSGFAVAEADEPRHHNVLSALAQGTLDGLRLALNVAAMLIAFLALIALLNGVLGWASGGLAVRGIPFPSSLQAILGYLFAPMALLIGIPWQDAFSVGNLLGTRMVTNELVAFPMLRALVAELEPRSFTIATFALTGFANLGSIAIQIGALSALAPNQRDEVTRLGLTAMLAGTGANLMSACVVGVLL
jgi:CNT family concentrative nucleoside transporter